MSDYDILEDLGLGEYYTPEPVVVVVEPAVAVAPEVIQCDEAFGPVFKQDELDSRTKIFTCFKHPRGHNEFFGYKDHEQRHARHHDDCPRLRMPREVLCK